MTTILDFYPQCDVPGGVAFKAAVLKAESKCSKPCYEGNILDFNCYFIKKESQT